MISHKSRRATLIKRTSAALLLVAFAALASAQPAQEDSDKNNWYQVEVVIFERLASPRTGDPEVWPKDIVLSYPGDWQKLIDSATADEWVAEIDRQRQTEANPATDAESQETPVAFTSTNSAETAESDVLEDALATPGFTEGEQTPQELKTPLLLRDEHREYAFVRLPAAERTLNESTSAINRDRLMRVVFHEAWRQPLTVDVSAPAVIVRGGNEYGSHTELEGSLRLSISRYLHLQTDLWFSRFIPNYGQAPEHWPRLPAVPERTRLEATADVQNSFTWNSGADVWQLSVPETDEYAELIDRPYLIQEIITLKQNRRMRSGELHYIDHPRLGLLIKIDNHDPTADDETNQ